MLIEILIFKKEWISENISVYETKEDRSHSQVICQKLTKNRIHGVT